MTDDIKPSDAKLNTTDDQIDAEKLREACEAHETTKRLGEEVKQFIERGPGWRHSEQFRALDKERQSAQFRAWDFAREAVPEVRRQYQELDELNQKIPLGDSERRMNEHWPRRDKFFDNVDRLLDRLCRAPSS